MAQADTIIPPGVQGLDRYAYVNNSPMNFVDPTGHIAETSDICDADGYCGYNGVTYSGIENGNNDNGDNPDDSLLDFVDENFNTDLCKGTVYDCGGNADFGYVFNPITGEIVTWNHGTDFKILNSTKSPNTTLTTDLTLFISAVKTYESTYDAGIKATLTAGGAAVVFTLTVFSGAGKIPFLGQALLVAEGGVALYQGYLAIDAFADLGTIREEQIDKYFTGILLNSEP